MSVLGSHSLKHKKKNKCFCKALLSKFYNYFLFSVNTNCQVFAISFKTGEVVIAQLARIISNFVSYKAPCS